MSEILRQTGFPLIAGVCCVFTLIWPGYGAQESGSKTNDEKTAAIPNFNGVWARSTFGWELRISGPGPLKNLRRRPNGTSDAQMLVGDYTGPVLTPRAAEIVKKHGEISEAGIAYRDPSNQCVTMARPTSSGSTKWRWSSSRI